MTWPKDPHRQSDLGYMVAATAEQLNSYVQKGQWYPEEHREEPDDAHNTVVRRAQCVSGKRSAA